MPASAPARPDPPLPLSSTGLRVAGADLPAGLRPYVHEVYEEVFEVPEGQSVCLPVSATTDPVLNVTLSGTVVAWREGRFRIPPFRAPPVMIGGPQPEAYAIRVTGRTRGFYVRFTTVGPFALLGVRDYGVSEHGAPPLHAIVRPALAAEARAWGDALLAAPDFRARVALTSRFLLARLPDVAPEAAFLQAALAEIERARGLVRVSALARALGVSAATLRRRFRVIGMPAKHFAGVVRFRHTHAFLHTTPGATWADAVARFGYTDQAHFAHDYRRYSGGPPTHWQPGERSVDRRMGIEGAFDPSDVAGTP